MRAEISDTTFTSVLSNPLYLRLAEPQRKSFDEFLRLSQGIWVGKFNGEVACIFGILSPTMLSNTAYLWLHCDEESVSGNQFLFVRYSQRIVSDLLKKYSTIVGYSHVEAVRSIRWLKWLGAKFGVPEGNRIPFMIRRKGI